MERATPLVLLSQLQVTTPPQRLLSLQPAHLLQSAGFANCCFVASFFGQCIQYKYKGNEYSQPTNYYSSASFLGLGLATTYTTANSAPNSPTAPTSCWKLRNVNTDPSISPRKKDTEVTL